MFSKLSTFAAVLGIAATAQAHTVWTNFYVDGHNYDRGVCVRMNNNPSQASFPVENLASNDMACGFSGMNGVALVCAAKAGSVVTFEGRWKPDDPTAGFIDSSHKGPVAVYMKKVDSAVTDTGVGDGWFKIFYDGFHDGKWGTERLMDTGGLFSVTIPSDIVGGAYLIRPEALALHSASNTPSDPQFYISCMQIYLTSDGTRLPSQTVAIPGPNYIVADTTPANFNIWYNPTNKPYPEYGPPSYAPGGPATTVSAVTAPQTEGLRPAGCILQYGNWCAHEVASYTTQDGCWASAKECWAENDLCWKSGPSIGGQVCKIWGTKCDGINAACSAGNYVGPPDMNKDLTPAPTNRPLPPTWVGNGATSASGYVPSTPTPAPSSSSVAPVSTSSAPPPAPPSSMPPAPPSSMPPAPPATSSGYDTTPPPASSMPPPPPPTSSSVAPVSTSGYDMPPPPPSSMPPPPPSSDSIAPVSTSSGYDMPPPPPSSMPAPPPPSSSDYNMLPPPSSSSVGPVSTTSTPTTMATMPSPSSSDTTAPTTTTEDTYPTDSTTEITTTIEETSTTTITITTTLQTMPSPKPSKSRKPKHSKKKSKTKSKTAMPTPPTMPTEVAPTKPGVPTPPTMPTKVLPTMPSKPTIPGLPSMPGYGGGYPSMPAMPSMPGLPTMPAKPIKPVHPIFKFPGFGGFGGHGW